ncbi:hypothetical protein H9P43_006417 [Blastocladiella emersonii ATCC 22665]|nr:hypothetical protein H9P43_006417 [Blastocladiella emersonii ATCC 22665]
MHATGAPAATSRDAGVENVPPPPPLPPTPLTADRARPSAKRSRPAAAGDAPAGSLAANSALRALLTSPPPPPPPSAPGPAGHWPGIDSASIRRPSVSVSTQAGEPALPNARASSWLPPSARCSSDSDSSSSLSDEYDDGSASSRSSSASPAPAPAPSKRRRVGNNAAPPPPPPPLPPGALGHPGALLHPATLAHPPSLAGSETSASSSAPPPPPGASSQPPRDRVRLVIPRHPDDPTLPVPRARPWLEVVDPTAPPGATPQRVTRSTVLLQGTAVHDHSARPHVCTDCGARFKRAEHLRRHARIHSGVLPFACPYPGCGKAFSRPDNRAQHLKTHERQANKDAADREAVAALVRGGMVPVYAIGGDPGAVAARVGPPAIWPLASPMLAMAPNEAAAVVPAPLPVLAPTSAGVEQGGDVAPAEEQQQPPARASRSRSRRSRGDETASASASTEVAPPAVETYPVAAPVEVAQPTAPALEDEQPIAPATSTSRWPSPKPVAVTANSRVTPPPSLNVSPTQQPDPPAPARAPAPNADDAVARVLARSVPEPSADGVDSRAPSAPTPGRVVDGAPAPAPSALAPNREQGAARASSARAPNGDAAHMPSLPLDAREYHHHPHPASWGPPPPAPPSAGFYPYSGGVDQYYPPYPHLSHPAYSPYPYHPAYSVSPHLGFPAPPLPPPHGDPYASPYPPVPGYSRSGSRSRSRSPPSYPSPAAGGIPAGLSAAYAASLHSAALHPHARHAYPYAYGYPQPQHGGHYGHPPPPPHAYHPDHMPSPQIQRLRSTSRRSSAAGASDGSGIGIATPSVGGAPGFDSAAYLALESVSPASPAMVRAARGGGGGEVRAPRPGGRGGHRRAGCACWNCCGIPVFLCRLIWVIVCLLLVVAVISAVLIGVFGGYCFNGGKLVRSESGTLDLASFTLASGGAAALQVLGQNYGRIILQTGANASSSLGYSVELYSARTPDTLPAPPRVETAGSRWTLYPLGMGNSGSPFENGNWLSWLHVDVCTRTVTTITVPTSFPKSATNVSLAITATNPDIDLFVADSGSAAGPTWDSVTVTASNGDISGRVAAAREVVTETTNGNTDLIITSAARVAMTGSGGDVSLTVDAAAGAITARTTNGKIRITAPGDWTYSAQTTNGDVKVDGRTVNPVRKSEVVSGTMGNASKAGGRTMTVATSNGDVDIRRV